MDEGCEGRRLCVKLVVETEVRMIMTSQWLGSVGALAFPGFFEISWIMIV